jgi:hypothetical protein
MRDAERLLSGYAAGLLSAEERSRLFAAALKDQALFEALADEDALRELLEDPAARAKVLAALAEPARAKVVPFYRRLPVLGAAASLMIALTTGLAYWRSQGLERLPRPEAQPAPTQTAPAAPASPKAEAEAPAKPLPAPPPPPPAPVAAGAAADKAETWTVERRKEAKKAAKQGLAPTGPAGGQAAALNQVSAVAAESQGSAQAGIAAFEASAALPRPLWTVERLEDGRTRVRVRWREGHLYLLRRAGAATTAVAATEDTRASDGMLERIYLVPAGAAALDLYLLPEPAKEPAALPAEGPLAGFRHRLRSE